jgi:hypothetical protein
MGGGENRVVTFIRPDDPPEEDLPQTFIDAYAEWAHTITDAPVQYHKATGAVILSTLMAPHICLPTSFGVFIPNIWVMILAGTTTTRKSTSMDIARRILDDVMDDYLLANDGSPEGLLTEMGIRDGRVSLFHRDEITGFMHSIMHKEYMAGTAEGLTRLYDGQPEERKLRRETISIKNPYLVIMSGGIKSRMEEIASMDHIRSGFLPRFIFVTGITSPDQMRPIGPPPDDEVMAVLGEHTPREQIIDRLWRIHRFYNEPEITDPDNAPKVILVAGMTKVPPPSQPKRIRLQGTPEFWNRMQLLEKDARDAGTLSSDPNLYAPMYDRLKNSILKVAILLCGAELRDKITEEDLIKAIHLSEGWLDTATEFAQAIEQHPHLTPFEKKIDKIVSWVKAIAPRAPTQTEVADKFRISKRDLLNIEETLMQRGLLLIDPFPNPKSRIGTAIRYYPPDVQKIRRIMNKENTVVTEEDGETSRPQPIRIPRPKSTDNDDE